MHRILVMDYNFQQIKFDSGAPMAKCANTKSIPLPHSTRWAKSFLWIMLSRLWLERIMTGSWPILRRPRSLIRLCHASTFVSIYLQVHISWYPHWPGWTSFEPWVIIINSLMELCLSSLARGSPTRLTLQILWDSYSCTQRCTSNQPPLLTTFFTSWLIIAN